MSGRLLSTNRTNDPESKMKSYEAIYEKDTLKWLAERPEIADGEHVIVMVKNREVPDKSEKAKIRETLNRAWGAWGTGKTLDEIDDEIRQMRERDWD
jgi:hypothetical protein